MSSSPLDVQAMHHVKIERVYGSLERGTREKLRFWKHV